MGDQQRNSVLLVQTLKTSPLFLVQLRHRRVLARAVVTELTRSTLPTHAPFQDVHAGPVAEFGVAQAAPTCGLRNEAFVGPRKARHNGLQRALAQVILAFKAYRRQGSRAVLENVAVLSLTTAAGERFLCCKTLRSARLLYRKPSSSPPTSAPVASSTCRSPWPVMPSQAFLLSQDKPRSLVVHWHRGKIDLLGPR